MLYDLRDQATNFQSSADNSKKKCQHRPEDPADPSRQSRAHTGLIIESVRIRKNCNETNLDKHSQKPYRDLAVSCDFSQCSHISESCYALNQRVQETGKRNSASTNVIYTSHGVCPIANRLTQNEATEGRTKYCSDSAADDDLQILLVDNEVSNVPQDVSRPVPEVFMDNGITSRHGFCGVDTNVDLVLEDKDTNYVFDSMNYMTIEELCPRNELCRIKRANFAYFRHSVCDPATKSQNDFLRQDRLNFCSHSCNSLVAGRQSDTGHNSIQSRATNKNAGANTQHYSKVASETNLKELITSRQHETFDGDHQSCTEDTVSTLGSLTSLKLFDATESPRPDLSISSEELNCQYSLLASANLAHSCTLSAGCVSQAPQVGHCSSGMTSKSLLSQADQGHQWERHSPVCNATASLGGSSDALNCVHGDQRRRSLQPGKFSISRAKLKTIKLTLTVVICYILCWAPFFFGQMWAAYDANAPYDGPFFSIIMLLASVNSCTNPWIYTIFSNTICQKTRDIFGAPCRCFAACWKEIRSYWSGKTPATSIYHKSAHVATKKRTFLEKNSFSTLG